MTTMTIDQTAAVLADMFTENTGRALCDSGDAYGRNWERNQGMAAQDFLDAPDAYWNYGPTLSTFHYINTNLTFSPVMDRLFSIYAVDSDRPYLADAEAFAAHMVGADYQTYNSYNFETFLDIVVQWVEFEYNSTTYVLLQVHGGADVRGGYTRARVFEADPWDLWYQNMMSADIFCSSGKLIPTGEYADEPVEVMGEPAVMPVMQFEKCDFSLHVSGSDISDRDGWCIDAPKDFWDKEMRCPDCGEPINISAVEY